MTEADGYSQYLEARSPEWHLSFPLSRLRKFLTQVDAKKTAQDLEFMSALTACVGEDLAELIGIVGKIDKGCFRYLHPVNGWVTIYSNKPQISGILDTDTFLRVGRDVSQIVFSYFHRDSDGVFILSSQTLCPTERVCSSGDLRPDQLAICSTHFLGKDIKGWFPLADQSPPVIENYMINLQQSIVDLISLLPKIDFEKYVDSTEI